MSTVHPTLGAKPNVLLPQQKAALTRAEMWFLWAGLGASRITGCRQLTWLAWFSLSGYSLATCNLFVFHEARTCWILPLPWSHSVFPQVPLRCLRHSPRRWAPGLRPPSIPLLVPPNRPDRCTCSWEPSGNISHLFSSTLGRCCCCLSLWPATRSDVLKKKYWQSCIVQKKHTGDLTWMWILMSMLT